ncbi:MAG: RNA-binding transcriptional accessory protein, partial [Alphaproteobacteria bacterium]|nr:RNA-binding transcriptional accessory protein [Alphaproteobacteria bacterium]
MSAAATASIARIIARELNVEEKQVSATIDLIGEGATVPFIARYRKERTGGLDDTQLRHLAVRLTYLTDLHARRDTILKSIREQGKLTPALEKQIHAAETKVALEDLYAPFKPKRRTKATIAREAGLAPLAEQLLANPNLTPAEIAANFVSKKTGITSPEEALEGARHIIVETLSETPEIVGAVREKMWTEGKVK